MSCTFFSTSSRAPLPLARNRPFPPSRDGPFFCLSFRFFPPAARTVSDDSGTDGSGTDDSGQGPTSRIRGTRPAPAGPVRHELTGTATGTMPGTMTATVRQCRLPRPPWASRRHQAEKSSLCQSPALPRASLGPVAPGDMRRHTVPPHVLTAFACLLRTAQQKAEEPMTTLPPCHASICHK